LALGLLIAVPLVAAAAPVDQAAVADYASAARPSGVAGGAAATALAKAVVDALRARSDVAEPDGALAAAAAWLLAANGDESRKRGLETAARRAGFVGAVLTASTFPVGEPDRWRRVLAALPRNQPVTRYAVYVSPDGGMAGVAFGDVALKLEPFPRHLRGGETLRLRGEVTRRFERASVYVTGPDGRVGKTRLQGRRIEADVPLRAPGIYRVEVMGDGAVGPVVLANVPIYVGVAEPALAADAEPAPAGAAPRSPEEAQARMLALLNDSRRAAGVAALAPDAELGAVALAHTRDMAAARFFGHVSPTTGHVEDRLRRAGVSATKFGENISQGDTADGAHRALMESPSHRANMLDPAFTQVGIAVVLRPGERPALLATLLFARRPRSAAAPLTSAAASDFVSSRRRARGALPLAFDPTLQLAAEAGLDVILRGGPAVAATAALDAAQAALARESQRLHQARPRVCAQLVQIAELEQLDGEPIVTDPRPGRVGLAAGTTRAGNADASFVLTVVESATCR
jgi:uncharacterized protein YkwD